MLGIILVATLVTAQVIINLTNAEFTPEPTGEIIKFSGNVTFDCRGSPMEVYVTSGDEKIDDDFEQVLPSVCTSLVTNAVDWNDRTYQQNEFGLRSFDEDILREDVCNRNGESYNSTSGNCIINVVGESLDE